ncbi:glycosyltransferase family 39 protein [Nocardia terpenica]|uniref:Glycosyl transferase family 39 n=1 Tax=Nocardia terpenica TaxID=455432 RepID=A0A291RIM4_9NOCA|nr:glycosyltransferase family 39 protein [Nocardia terpenica]ATL66994.1 glycosyl transferase family 39 [Nocardia terpenica]
MLTLDIRPTTSRAVPPFATSGVVAVALILGVAYVWALGRPGFWGDELYFVAAGHRPSISYADQGPLIPAIAWLMDIAAPDSPLALRLPATLASIATVALPALIAREFGGGRGAQVLAATTYATSLFVVFSKPLCTQAFDLPLTAAVFWLLIRWVRVRRDGLLILAGVAAALAVQVKWLVPIHWACLGAAVLIAGPREMLRRPALWAGSAIFAAAWAPALVWQANHGWPQLKMAHAIAAENDAFTQGPLLDIPLVVAYAGLLGAILLPCGLWHLLRAADLRPYRFLLVAAVLLTVVLLATGARAYYGAAILPAFLAAGAVRICEGGVRRWMKPVGAVVIAASVALVVIPLSVLPLPQSRLHDPTVTTGQVLQRGFLYGQSGWDELALATADAYRDLPPPERSTAVVVTESYWQASALDHYRNSFGLPAVYSPNRGFGYFGAPPDSATTVVYVGGDPAVLRSQFAEVRPLLDLDERLGFPGITKGITIWRCDGPVHPWSAAWPGMMSLEQHYL